MAAYDYDQSVRILDWPLRELIESYWALLKEEVSEDYDLQLQIWSTLAAGGRAKEKRPPKPPEILEK